MNLAALMESSRKVELGNPPWSEDLLRDAYFANFVATREAIKKHPGYYFHKMLENEKGFLKIFANSVDDLLNSIELFNGAYDQKKLYARHQQDLLNEYVIRVTQNMVLCAGGALALVGWSHRMEKKVIITTYEDKIKRLFDENPRHRFIQDLRNSLLHGYFLLADWQRLYSKETQTFFLLKEERLLEYKKWHSLSKRFIVENPRGIDITSLFISYKRLVLGFHKWYSSEILREKGAVISEYRQAENLLNRFGAHAEYRLVLTEAIKRKIDPYEHLEGRFSEDELKAIHSLPKNSKEQVDKIIEIVDEYGACDEELRNLVYKLFGIS